MRVVVPILVLAGILIGVAGVLAVYVRDTIVDSDEAAKRAAAALAHPDVRDFIAEKIVEQVVAAQPDAMAARPLLKQVVTSVLGAGAFRPVYEAAIRDVHQTVFLGNIDTLTVQLTDVVLIVRTQAAVLSPELSAQIPDGLTDTLIEVQSHPLILDAVQTGEDIRLLAFVLPLASIMAFGASIFLASDRRQAWVRVGLGIIAIGLVVLVIEVGLGELVVRYFEDDATRNVARAFWKAFVSDLNIWALFIAGFGTMMVTAVWWMSEPADVAARLGQVRRFMEPPTTALPRLFWVAIWMLTGAFLVLRWQEAARLIVTLAGLILVVNAMAELLRMMAPGQMGTTSSMKLPVSRAAVQRLLAGAGLLAAIAVIAGGYLAIDRSSGAGVAVEPFNPACNGHVLLCDRRLDDVTIAATHNSMSNADDQFVLANHSKGIIPQLEAGYRGLLIDLYYGIESERSQVVVTDVAPSTPEERERLVQQLGSAAVRSAEELRKRNLDAGGVRDVYLCHIECEIGAVRFSIELERIRIWLEDNPREVLFIIIEDRVHPDDVAHAFEASGLVEYAHTQVFGEPWPTLLEMIDSSRRLVVMAENDTGGVPWYHHAFTFAQETPYTFESVDEFDCSHNRGQPDSPLFMVNHWVTPALAQTADLANSSEILKKRIADCQEERGMTPNIIGIDFYARGDALAVVAAHNGVQ